MTTTRKRIKKTTARKKKFTLDQLEKLFDLRGFVMGRILGSKSYYRERFPNDDVFFNANAVTLSHKKIWYGDIHLQKDSEILKEIACLIGEPIYILKEMDCRFGQENLPTKDLISRAVWNTDL